MAEQTPEIIDLAESLLSSPGTINYWDKDGDFVIAPKTPYYIARKRAWEKRIGRTAEAEQDGV